MSSDKYLQKAREEEAQRLARKMKNKKKKKKHKKGSKKHADTDSDEEDDVPTLHAVSAVYDVPEVKIARHLR